MENKQHEYENLIRSIAEQLEKSQIGAYIDLMQNPLRMIVLNLASGIARGFGIAVGFTILGALVVYLLNRLVVLNIPIISGLITEIVKLVQLNTSVR